MTSNKIPNSSIMFVEIIERNHKIESLREQERKLRDENIVAMRKLTRVLCNEQGNSYPNYVEKLVINVDGRKYHPEIDPEDGEITLTEVTYRDVEVKQ